MPHDAFITWGWRIPFLSSILVIIAGYIIRRAAVAPPGSVGIPFIIGSIAFSVTIIAAAAAWSAREAFRIHINDLGHPRAIPVDKQDYERARAQAYAGMA